MEKAQQKMGLKPNPKGVMEYILKYFSEFTDTQLKQFEALEPLYKEWNEKINIISRKDIEACI